MSKKVTFIASGDSFITRPLPDNGYDVIQIEIERMLLLDGVNDQSTIEI